MNSLQIRFPLSIILTGVLLFSQQGYSISPDSIYVKNIKTARLYPAGNQLSIPVINLASGDQVELHFDDMDADVKYYYYTYQLCNYDWSPANVSPFDYLKGFTQMRITSYRLSSIAYTRYTHYQAVLPDRNTYPMKSGNYIVKVFLDGDTSKLAFTKRLMVVDNQASIIGKIAQPFAPEYFRTHQRVQFAIDVKKIVSFDPQRVKVVVLQNYRWDNAIKNIIPTFIRGTVLDYNSEDKAVFPAGKEWRWVDLRDFHLQSDRVLTADYKKNSTDIYLKPDAPREGERYVYFRDFNGMYLIEPVRGYNPYWESDYATVYFSFLPPGGVPYANANLYLYGQLTNYNYIDSLQLQFNAAKGLYETHILLKQGYYDYTYVAVDKSNPSIHNELNGNYYETENIYSILVYYKSFIARTDELIGVATFDSRTDRPGLSF